MDAAPIPPFPDQAAGQPSGHPRVALVLQGGGALGAYQVGVYQALHEAGLEPDWLAGVSIGAINGAIIAGNPPEKRLERLTQFWDRVCSRSVLGFMPGDFLPWSMLPGGDTLRRLHSMQSSVMSIMFGQPGFFSPALPEPFALLGGLTGMTSVYNSAPLRDTLLELVDFGRLNNGDIRYACGAVNVETGNFAYFDNARITIGPEHVMASGALPPSLPAVQIGEEAFWDGGIVSNTPLQHLLHHNRQDDMLVFQVDLFSARGPRPLSMLDVLSRHKDIQYSSRTRLVTDYHTRLQRVRVQLKRLLDRMDDADLDAEQRLLKHELATLPRISLLQLVYQQSAWENESRDYDFSLASMRHHRDAGGRDTRATLQRRDWLVLPEGEASIVTHDIHRPDDSEPVGQSVSG